MKTLISMTAFVKEQYELFIQDKITCEQFRERVWKYANFLSLTPEIWQFVPCKLVDGVLFVLEEPEKFKNWTNYEYSGTDIGFEDERLCREYQTAKERCYFDGFEFVEGYKYGFKLRVSFDGYEEFITILNEETIEDLLTYSVDFDWTLTATAQKEIGL